MSAAKEIMYDWLGLNKWLFKQVNALRGETYDNAMQVFSQIGDYHNFPYYVMGLLIYALVTYVVRSLRRKSGTKHYISAWIGVFAVLAVGFLFYATVIRDIKDYFHYPRPYVELSQDNIRHLEQREAKDNNRSFPSGHAAFTTLMVVALWPVLSEGLYTLGMLLIFGVAWSRIAMGVHYPADVLGGFLIMAIAVAFIRNILNWLLHKLFGIHC